MYHIEYKYLDECTRAKYAIAYFVKHTARNTMCRVCTCGAGLPFAVSIGRYSSPPWPDTTVHPRYTSTNKDAPYGAKSCALVPAIPWYCHANHGRIVRNNESLILDCSCRGPSRPRAPAPPEKSGSWQAIGGRLSQPPQPPQCGPSCRTAGLTRGNPVLEQLLRRLSEVRCRKNRRRGW